MRSWLNLLQWWQFRRRYRWRRLEREALSIDIPPGRLPACQSCQGLCCREPNLVSLRLSDLARLVDVGLGWAAVPALGGGRQATYREHPELAALEGLDSFRWFPVLAQTDGHCVFLGPDDRCAIHSIRPLDCRRYPYLLATDLQRVRWAGGCPYWVEQGGAGEQEALVGEVLAHFEQKLRDLAWLEFAPRELEALGLGFAARTAGSGERFAAVLRERRGRRGR